jgi:hypothetical protein
MNKTMTHAMPWVLLLIALMAKGTWAQTSYDKVLYLAPPLSTSCLAVEIPTPEGQGLSGLRWFHNDAQVAFPRLVLMEGDPAEGPDLSNTALILLEVTGASLAWGEVDFGGPVASSTGTAYAVFYFPEGEPTTGLGSGPGIGIRQQTGGAPFYLTGDAQKWVQFDQSYAIGIEPVYASGKTAPRLLNELKGEVVEQAPTEVTPVRYETALLSPRPNPFNPRVEIAFTLEKAQAVELTIFDVRGRLVATLLHEERPAGSHSVVWEGRDKRGHSVASGSYFARLTAGDFTARRNLVLLR